MSEIDEAKIRSALNLLTFDEPYHQGSEFVDFTPSLPAAYARLEGHDFTSAAPPEGMTSSEYETLGPTFVILQVALSEHDVLVGSEETERFREDFWAAYGDPDEHGAKVLRRSYVRLLGDRILQTLQAGGEGEFEWIATYRQIWADFGRIVVSPTAG